MTTLPIAELTDDAGVEHRLWAAPVGQDTDRDAAVDQSSQLAYRLDAARTDSERLREQLTRMSAPPETVDGITRETGLPRDDLLAQLSRLLPEVIDKLASEAGLVRYFSKTTGPWDVALYRRH